MKKFGDHGSEEAAKKMDQQHHKNTFNPIDVGEPTSQDKRKSMEALVFMNEKRDKSIRGKMVYNGKPTQEWLSREDSESPTISLESILLTVIVDSKKNVM